MSEPHETDRSSGPGVRVPPPVIYIAGFAAGGSVERVARSPELPRWLRLVGAIAGIGTLVALDTAATVRFARKGTPLNPARPAKALITDGPYRFTRNPMYIGMAGAYAGAAVAARVLWALPFLPAVLVVVHREVIPREEAHLAWQFGNDYERYRARVRRWL